MKKQILGFLIVLGLIILLINTDFNNLIEKIKLIPLKVFAFTLGLQIITMLSIGFQWKKIVDIICPGRKFYSILKINLKGNIFDAITPGAKVGGGLAKVYEMKNGLDISLNNSIVALSLQKSVSIFSFISLGIISILYINNIRGMVFTSKNYYYMILSILLSGLLLILSLVFYPIKIKKLVDRCEFKKKEKLNNFLNLYIENIEKIKKNKKNLLLNIVLGLFIWVLYAVKLIILVRVFNREINVLILVGITYISYLIGGIPLLPGSIGSFESGLGSLLYISGLTLEESMVISIAFRFVTFWFEFIISGIIIILDRILYKKVKGGEYA